MWIVLLVIACIISAGITYLVMQPKTLVTEILNENIKRQNEELEEKHLILQQKIKDKNEEILKLDANINSYQAALDSAKRNFEKSLQEVRVKYLEAEQAYKEEYENTILDLSSNLQVEMIKSNETLSKIQNSINDYKEIQKAVISANKRAEEIKENEKFFKINLTEKDLQEIEALRSIGKTLRNPEPLNKVIWKCYYEKPTSDMIGRVIGSNNKIGIYKITNLQNGKCYVGQSVNIGR